MGILFPFLIYAQISQTSLSELTIDTQDNVLSVNLHKSLNDKLYQIVLTKTDKSGKIEWKTNIPTSQTGYDSSFTGEDAYGNYLTETNPKPFVSKIKKVADGYILINNHRVYFPPGINNIFATFIKLDLGGNLLWSSKQTIPTQGNIVGSAPSSAGNSKYFIGDVNGFEDGKTYISYTGGEDFHTYAQVRILDNKGKSIANYSSTSLLSDGASFQVKKFNNRIYWLNKTELILDNKVLNFDSDFCIMDITDGFEEGLTTPVALHLPSANTAYIPNDMQLNDEGDFLVKGFKYPVKSDKTSTKKSNATPFSIVLEVDEATKEMVSMTNKRNEEEGISFVNMGDNIDTDFGGNKFTTKQKTSKYQNWKTEISTTEKSIALALNRLTFKTCKRYFAYKNLSEF